MAPRCILFDLDGTLTDSGSGIMNCAAETFRHYGIEVPDEKTLRTMVGPPLRSSFQRFGIASDKVDEAVAYYRALYQDHGKYDNTPYPGVLELVQKLKADGHRLFVATSKPEHMSVDIMEHFGLAPYFERICGSLLDGVRDKKAAVIEYLLEGIGPAEGLVMVGDTVFDVLGAAELNIPTIAVSWGYGINEELVQAGAVRLVHTAQELYEALSE